MRFKIEDFPPAVQERIRRQLGEEPMAEKPETPVRASKHVEPTKTELKYQREILRGEGIWTPLTLRLPGGSRYTPDYMTVDASGRVTLHEVKGSYRLGSQGRAATAFRECVAAFPMFSFVWAHWTGAEWDIKKAGRPTDRPA